MAAGSDRSAAWWAAIAGVLAIGLVNVVVSFVLALWLALRAAEARTGSRVARAVVRVGLHRWAMGQRRALPAAHPAAHDAVPKRRESGAAVSRVRVREARPEAKTGGGVPHGRA
jgi:hypothetical protein